jgi:hypothetical protein
MVISNSKHFSANCTISSSLWLSKNEYIYYCIHAFEICKIALKIFNEKRLLKKMCLKEEDHDI